MIEKGPQPRLRAFFLWARAGPSIPTSVRWYPSEMKSRHMPPHQSFMYLWIVGAILVLAGLGYSYIQSHPAGIIDGQHEGDVRTTVAAFGNKLNTVSHSSLTLVEDIRSAYTPYVTSELLARWEADPARAPGRTASGAWPDYIVVDSVTMNDVGAYDVTGRVILVTATGDAGIIPIALTVTDVGGSFLISRYEERTGPSLDVPVR